MRAMAFVKSGSLWEIFSRASSSVVGLPVFLPITGLRLELFVEDVLELLRTQRVHVRAEHEAQAI